jgi:hypothetical protein
MDEEDMDVYLFISPVYETMIGIGVGERQAFLTPDQARELAVGMLEAIKEIEGADKSLH